MIRILKALQSNGTSDIHEIKDKVNLSVSRVRELVKEAIARGLVEGTPDSDDIMCYDLTEDGRLFLDPAMDDEPEAQEEEAESDVPEVLEEPEDEPAPAPVKAKRVVLNPQPVINKKTELLAAAGYALTYASREWAITHVASATVHVLTSKELSETKAADIVSYAVAVVGPVPIVE